MKKGDIVKFKKEVDPGDDKVRMRLLEDPDGGRVFVESLIGLTYNPTARYLVDDLMVCDEDNS